MKTIFLNAALLMLAVFLSACGEDESLPADQYIRLSINGVEDLNITGTTGSFDANPIIANVTVAENGGLAANTVQIGAAVIDEGSSNITKSLSISLQGLTAPGTYDLVEKEGIFVYSTATGNTFQEGYQMSLDEHGVCTVTITEISDQVRPGIGKPIKGTFSATVVIDDAGNTHTLTGEFNGGV